MKVPTCVRVLFRVALQLGLGTRFAWRAGAGWKLSPRRNTSTQGYIDTLRLREAQDLVDPAVDRVSRAASSQRLLLDLPLLREAAALAAGRHVGGVTFERLAEAAGEEGLVVVVLLGVEESGPPLLEDVAPDRAADQLVGPGLGGRVDALQLGHLHLGCSP